jgi:hydrogenase expression/formation protein HypE
MTGDSGKAKGKSIEVEVQSKHYRPVASKWLANGVVMVNGKPVYWKAARQYAQWEISPTDLDGWSLEGDAQNEATQLIERALQENRKFLSHVDVEQQEEVPSDKDARIALAHGGGGSLMHELIQKVVLRRLDSPGLGKFDDSAMLPRQSGRLVLTTDSFVVRPLFFPGGDIGRLAVCGSVNNVAVSGAKPLAISLGLIVEEGLPIQVLDEILDSVRATADEVGIKVVTGDTRVVERGRVDRVFINTAGVGTMLPRIRLSLGSAKQGDTVLISGNIGSHGLAVACARDGLELKESVKSDLAPVHGLAAKLLKAKISVRCMKDPTRGGIAVALNLIAGASGAHIELDEEAIPVSRDVRASCELLGLDPLYLESQGRILLVCSDATAVKALEVTKKQDLGRDAAIIGRVTGGRTGQVTLKAKSGASRIVDMPYGEQQSRII